MTAVPNPKPMIRAIVALTCLLFVTNVQAGTVLDFWHSYVPPQTGQKHYSFHVTNCKRGIFFGSCGISTTSQQWAFTVDLTGENLIYSKDQVSLSSEDGNPLKVVSGQITINQKQTVATIDLVVDQSGATNNFVGNGTYKIKKLK